MIQQPSDEATMIAEVVDVEPRSSLVVFLEFRDGASGLVDLSSLASGPVFEPVRNSEDYFRRVEVDRDLGTIVWPNGADLAPDVLRSRLKVENRVVEQASAELGVLSLYARIRGSQLHYGDNLAVLRERIPSESVDLVYLDPPFNSKRTYNVLYRSAAGETPRESVRAFEDFWIWDSKTEQQFGELVTSGGKVASALKALRTLLDRSDLMAYLVMMAPRLVELRRVLKPTGSIYLHCDQNASHYLKVVMDVIFGSDNFLNDVVWLYGLGGSSTRYWPRKHDDLLWYSKSPNRHYFEADTVPATSRRMAGAQKKATDYWDIPSINNMAKERIGFPTQKPLALLERIVRSSSPSDGVVLDPFCGCGTTVEAAERLGRTWVGIDVSYLAVDIIENRLRSSFGTTEAADIGCSASRNR
jgi:DNA modification methylase